MASYAQPLEVGEERQKTVGNISIFGENYVQIILCVTRLKPS